jgi:hypothetical protein
MGVSLLTGGEATGGSSRRWRWIQWCPSAVVAECRKGDADGARAFLDARHVRFAIQGRRDGCSFWMKPVTPTAAVRRRCEAADLASCRLGIRRRVPSVVHDNRLRVESCTRCHWHGSTDPSRLPRGKKALPLSSVIEHSTVNVITSPIIAMKLQCVPLTSTQKNRSHAHNYTSSQTTQTQIPVTTEKQELFQTLGARHPLLSWHVRHK